MTTQMIRTPAQMKLTEDTCPDKDKHTPSPDGYVPWSEWADMMVETHKQVQCATCGLWAIWKPKRKKTSA